MPTDACLFFYDCPGCGALLKPRGHVIAVLRSFADVPCPPMQARKGLQVLHGNSCACGGHGTNARERAVAHQPAEPSDLRTISMASSSDCS